LKGGGEQRPHVTYSIMHHHEHEKASSRRKGVKGEIQKEGRQGTQRTRNKQVSRPRSDRHHRQGRTRGRFQISEHGYPSRRTHAHQSRSAPSEGCAHPPIQPTQLLRKLLKPFIFAAPYGGIARGRGGNVPRIVPLE